jgi:hypothetical protein
MDDFREYFGHVPFPFVLLGFVPTYTIDLALSCQLDKAAWNQRPKA